MAELLILEFAGLNDADYAAVNGNLGIDMETGKGDWPAGLQSHAARPERRGHVRGHRGLGVPGRPGRVPASHGWARRWGPRA